MGCSVGTTGMARMCVGAKNTRDNIPDGDLRRAFDDIKNTLTSDQPHAQPFPTPGRDQGRAPKPPGMPGRAPIAMQLGPAPPLACPPVRFLRRAGKRAWRPTGKAKTV
jgi:hypothetical protein